MTLPEGIYDLLITERLAQALGALPNQSEPLTVASAEPLAKSVGYHDAIAYQDHAISASLFHWQTQNSAGPDTPAGRRYLESPGNGWQFQLFVRGRNTDPYRACGPATLQQAEGERPMSLVWQLHTPLPARLFAEFSVLRGA